jgi:hypothetical protein
VIALTLSFSVFTFSGAPNIQIAQCAEMGHFETRRSLQPLLLSKNHQLKQHHAIRDH